MDLELAIEKLIKGEIGGIEYRQTILEKEIPRYRLRRFGDGFAFHEVNWMGGQGSGIYKAFDEEGLKFIREMHRRRSEKAPGTPTAEQFIEIDPLTPAFEELRIDEAANEELWGLGPHAEEPELGNWADEGPQSYEL